MIGTITNTVCIAVGTLAGCLMRKGIKDRYKESLFNAMGLASIALGCNAFVQNISKSEFPVLFILNYIPALIVPIIFYLGKCIIQ